MTPEQQQAITDLRSHNVPPKLIARQLGLRPAEVSAFIKTQASQANVDREAAGELDPVFQCLVNKGCLAHLLADHRGTARSAIAERSNDPSAGLAAIMLARQVGFNRLKVCGYLVDYWCLGVKDTLGPRRMDPIRYNQLVNLFFSRFPNSETEEISMELAQAIVFGAVAYAERLGLSPHRDFVKVRDFLGAWDGQPQLTFGRNGKPCYIQGPYDNAQNILKALTQSVGEGNFDYMMTMGEWDE
jgi:hypothetical protein